jgi:hypothetical protein
VWTSAGGWSALGTGAATGTAVYALAVADSLLVAAGHFSSLGGASANNIAQWTGQVWVPLGLGLNGAGRALAVFHGVLLVGGSFTTAGGVGAPAVASWDGDEWTALASASGAPTGGHALALLPVRNVLLVGGSLTMPGPSGAVGLASFDGTLWRSNSTLTPAEVRVLVVVCVANESGASCTDCIAGYYRNDLGACVPCPANTFNADVSDADTCSPCPGISTTIGTGATSVTHCQCPPGAAGASPSLCTGPSCMDRVGARGVLTSRRRVYLYIWVGMGVRRPSQSVPWDRMRTRPAAPHVPCAES